MEDLKQLLLEEQAKTKALQDQLNTIKRSAENSEESIALQHEISDLRLKLHNYREIPDSADTMVTELRNDLEMYEKEMSDANDRYEDQCLHLKAVEAELEKYKAEVAHSNDTFLNHTEQLNSLQVRS